MATAKANKKKAAAAVDLPECPVCFETMCAPIYQCKSGHSLCSTCTTSLSPPLCPICRQEMTHMRNWQLEEIIAKAMVPCPNKSAGCVYTMMSLDVENHLNECIFRQMDCPLGAVFGKCTWKGKLTDMMNHFKERHPKHCNVTTDAEVELEKINLKEDDRYVYLATQNKLLFIITIKIDISQKMAYWTIQHIGSKKVAIQHLYEIHISSKKDARRKVVFTEHCFNDAISADEVFRQGKCAILPLDSLNNYVKDNKMSFRFFIKRIPPNGPKVDSDKNENKPQHKGPKGLGKDFGPGPNAGPKGPGPKKYNKTNQANA